MSNTEQKLKESEERYRELANSLPQVISEADERGNLTFVNKNAYTVFGYTPDDFNKGLNALQMLIPEDRKRAMENIKKVLRGKKEERMGVNEYTALRKDGSTFPVIIYSSPIIYKDISVGMRSITIDITDKIKAEQKLKESEEKYRLISETAYDLIGVLNKKFKYEYINETAFQQILGYSSEDLLGKSALQFTHPEDISITAKALFDGFKQGKGGAELRFKHKDGHWVWIEAKGRTFFDKDRDSKAIIISRDITRRKQAERELQLERDNFLNILGSMEDGVCIINQQYNIEYANPSLSKEFGQFEGIKCFKYFEDRNDICPRCKNKEIFQGKTVRGEWFSFKNQKTYDLIDTPLKNPDGSISKLTIMRDETDKKQAEVKLKESEEKFRTAVKNSPDYILFVKRDGIIFEVNRLEKGFTREMVIGQNVFNEIFYETGDQIVSVRKAFGDSLKTGETTLYESSQRAPDGSIRIYETRVSPFEYDNENKIISFQMATRDITDKKKAEQKLKENEVWLSTTLNSIGDAVIATDNNGQISFLNPVSESLTDWKHDEAIGKPIEDVFNIVNEKTRERVESPVSRVLREGVVVGLANHTILIAKNGKEIPIADSGAPLIDDKGDTIGVVLVFRDISEQRKAEHIIEERVKELNCLYSISKIVEEEFVEIGELLSKAVEFVPPAWQFPEVTCARIVVDGQEYKTVNFKETKWKQASDIIIDKEKIGTVEICYLDEMPEFDEGPFLKEERHLIDNIAAVLGIYLERKKKEEKIRLQSEIIENMSEGVYLIKLDDGTIVYTNPAFDDMFGYNPGEMIGKDVAIVNAPIDKKPEETKDEIMGILKETGEWHGEVLNVKKDGIPFWCYANVSLFDHLEYGTVIVAVHTDITERKKVKENIRILMEDLKRSNVELEQFAYIASHDLQEPLRMVSGFASLLEKRYKESLDKDAHEFIEFIIDGATRMQDLINDLLTFSRIGTKGTIFKPTDMNIVLEAVLNNVRISAIETNAIITNDPLPVIIADESQIVQLLQNLISNAIKFHGLVPPKIHISGETKKNEWIFTVRDNGIGIDSKNFERIFVIFQRLFKKEEFPGTGIGLAVCKKIVQHHRGKIWVESELKKGSTFYFSIPRNQNGGSKNKKVLYSN